MQPTVTLRRENWNNQTQLFNDHVLHKYAGENAKVISELLDSGSLSDLVTLNLIAKFEVVKRAEDSLVIKQDRGPVIYAFEQPFEAIREIALKTLTLHSYLHKLGFGLTDAHADNWINFDGEFKFVDFGSFVKKSSKNDLLFSELEFRRQLLTPLRFFKKKKLYLARILLGTSQSSFMASADLVDLYASNMQRIILKLFPRRLHAAVVNLFFAIGAPVTLEMLSRFIGHSSLLTFFASLYIKFCRPIVNTFAKLRIRSYSRTLENMQTTKRKGERWSSYAETLELSDNRAFEITKLVRELQPKSVVDVGGNDGQYGNHLINSISSLTDYVVLDSDNVSINRGMRSSWGSKITFAFFNFSAPTVDPNQIHYSRRFRADLVLALAVTHHILLTDNLSPSIMFSRFAELTNRDIIVEFMPWGLWVPGRSKDVPLGYELEEFKAEFVKHFDLCAILEVGDNRILLHGKKRPRT
jgi:hypothetical protein